MRALITVLLLATLIVVDASVARAADASSDAYARGYAAAVLEREFKTSAPSLAVADGVLTLDAADLAGGRSRACRARSLAHPRHLAARHPGSARAGDSRGRGDDRGTNRRRYERS